MTGVARLLKQRSPLRTLTGSQTGGPFLKRFSFSVTTWSSTGRESGIFIRVAMSRVAAKTVMSLFLLEIGISTKLEDRGTRTRILAGLDS